MHPSLDPSAADGDQELDLLDLTCPACDSDLIADELFLSHRVCGSCNRHFSIGARERIALLVDGGVFEELNTTFAPPESTLARDRFPSAERLAEHHHLQVIGEAVVSGLGRVGGVTTVVVALDDHLVGASLGALMTEKIILALDYARSRKHPLVLLCAGAATSGQAGPLALVQGGRLATAFSQLHLEGVPVAGVLTHPIAGPLFANLAAHCDVLYSEPGVLVSGGTADGGMPNTRRWQPADTLAAEGWIDAIVDRSRIRGQIAAFIDVVGEGGFVRPGAAPVPRGGVAMTAAEALANLEHPDRPGSAGIVASLVSGFVELRGDRVSSDNQSVTCGIGRIDSLPVAICAQRGERELETASPDASAARKIARLARLAGRLELPLVMLVDGGASSQPAPFSPEAAYAVSSLATMIAQLPVPVIAIGTGKVAGPLSTSLMIGDRQFLMSSAVYAAVDDIIPGGGLVPGSPRRPRNHGRVNPATGVLTARECEELGLIDGVINEPRPGAHADPDAAFAAVRSALLASLAELTGTGQRRLLDTRHRRQRTLGQSTPEGLAAVRSELWELHEWQRSVGRSLDEWRERWDQLKLSQPRISFQRPDINDLAAKLRARRTELLERARIGDRSGE
ncbi:MAG: hypothetical protein H0V37_09835 [Chloroflexia bacterium]|nr:hypothetical protein [Chloroflexia bacterium]